jgi:hypothetical protein
VAEAGTEADGVAVVFASATKDEDRLTLILSRGFAAGVPSFGVGVDMLAIWSLQSQCASKALYIVKTWRVHCNNSVLNGVQEIKEQ